jgi:hypothetical protein
VNPKIHGVWLCFHKHSEEDNHDCCREKLIITELFGVKLKIKKAFRRQDYIFLFMYGGGGLLDFRRQGIELSGIGAVGER